jgi:mono/diheme cytochrome c family protein
MRKVMKFLGWGFLGAVGLLCIAVLLLSRRTYDAPLPRIVSSKDPEVIARGRYLAYGPAHCVDCHGAAGQAAKAAAGEGGDIPLSGGFEFRLPVGIIRTPNLTADLETGIGGMSDGEIARALRYGVGRDGRALAPFMPFANLSDEDLTALVSFLRSQAPVRNEVVVRELNPLGLAVVAFAIRPQGPTREVPKKVVAEATAEYGRYLVEDVGNCVGCHTQRDMVTGKFIGAPLAGGNEMRSEASPDSPIRFVSPNLTPHPTTGRLANWTEEVFVARFHLGRGAEGSPMPWKSFGRMNDTDLRAIYRYLSGVAPVENDTGESVRSLTEARAEASN